MGIISTRPRGVEREMPLLGSGFRQLTDFSLGDVEASDVLSDVTMPKTVRWMESLTTRLPGERVLKNSTRVYKDLGYLEVSSPTYADPQEGVIYACCLPEVISVEVGKTVGAVPYSSNIAKSTGGYAFFGTHYNVLLSRKRMAEATKDNWEVFRKCLVPWMVARTVLQGIGHPVRIGGRLEFVISPRSLGIAREVSLSTTDESRGLVNTRDEPHANPEKFFRYHDINFEAVRSPFQFYLMDCANALVYSAFDRGFIDRRRVEGFYPGDVRTSLREISAVESFPWEYTNAEGKRVSVFDVFDEYISSVEEMFDEAVRAEGAEVLDGDAGFTADRTDAEALKLIERVVDEFRNGNVEKFEEGIDWVKKWVCYGETRGRLERDDGELVKFLLSFGCVGSDSTEAYLRGRKTAEERYVGFDPYRSLEYFKKAVGARGFERKCAVCLATGPSGTRDRLKSAIMNNPRVGREVVACGWEFVEFRGGEIVRFSNRVYYPPHELEDLAEIFASADSVDVAFDRLKRRG